MKKIIALTALAITVVMFSFTKTETVPVQRDFKIAEAQYSAMISNVKRFDEYPRTALPDGTLKNTDLQEWTSGFWPGSLWYLYEYTKDEKWKTAATRWTNTLAANQYNKTTHDLGFMMYCSYGNAYRLTGDKEYRDILIQSAKSLATRFDARVGCIRSWDPRLSWDGKTTWQFPVIIDNMMNLELLFFASKESGDPTYRNIAITHAETTMKNHIRPDFSSYHVVSYDPQNGQVLSRETFQGFSNNSTWARGEAWGIYGFTIVYRETQDKRFLNTARQMADFYLHNHRLPADKISLWDFNVNEPGFVPLWKYDARQFSYIPRDASAAAITASAFLELSTQLGQEGKPYFNAAVEILKSLSGRNYLAKQGTNNNFILKHSVGSIPHGFEIDKPIVYADYYFLEALLRYQKLASH